MRLTKKDEDYSYSKLLNKIQILEDIEEEFGIDLIVLFKALKNGIYAIKYDEIRYFNEVSIKLDTKHYGYITAYSKQPNYIVFADKFQNYGKTWALTKEELL